MAPTVPSCLPTEHVAGETLKARLRYVDFPAGDGWVLAIYFRGVAVLDALMTGDTPEIEADGDSFLVTLSATDTALAAGTYRWTARATLDGETYQADAGVLTLRPNVATATAGALQTHAERMVAVLESEIAARITGDGSAHGDMLIGSRRLVKIATHELEGMLNRYRWQVWREQHPGQLGPRRQVRFVG